MSVLGHRVSRLRAGTLWFTRDHGRGLRYALPLTIHPEVEEALDAGRPVVALESAIITHGMPHPINLDTALSCERIIRSTGAIPATICLLSGRIHVGLKASQIERLADPSNAGRIKVSRRDLAPAIAARRDGGTTIASTMTISHLAGIKVFSTGGLGGVHRGGELSLDVSADVTELGRTPVAVVSAGIKSILDVGRTLEYLETEGVTVGNFGPSKDFPAFFSRKSGFQCPWNFESTTQVAEMLYAQYRLQLSSGALIACPIPDEYEEAGLKIQQSVEQAIRESEEYGVSRTGKDATPWLLRRVADLTGGASIPNNIALVENTSRIGGEIAVEYARLVAEGIQYAPTKPPTHSRLSSIHNLSSRPSARHITSETLPSSSPSGVIQAPRAQLLVVGATAVDVIARGDPSTDPALMVQSTIPGRVSINLGGVARNMAEAAHRSLASMSLSRSSKESNSGAVQLVSPIGKDRFSALISNEMNGIGMRNDGLLSKPPDGSRCTPVCNMILTPAGDLVGGVADFSALDTFNFGEISGTLRKSNAKVMAMDGNLNPNVISDLVQYASERHLSTWYEPTSVIKSIRIHPALHTQYQGTSSLPPISFISPNIFELEHLFRYIRDPLLDQTSRINLSSFPRWFETIDSFELGTNFNEEISRLRRSGPGLDFLAQKGVMQMTIQLLPFFQHIIVKCGSQGVFVAMHLYPYEAIRSAWLSTQTDMTKHLIVKITSKGAILVFQHFPAHLLPKTSIVNATGAGDSLVGSLLASLIGRENNPFHDPGEMDQVVHRAQKAAVLTLCSPFAVSPKLSER